MKYIRTKDGIMPALKIDEHHFQGTKQGEKIPDWSVKQADTIEELCDEAVFFDEDNVPHYKSKEGNMWYLGAGLFTESLRFGIFTDKALIYVAKMNDKGELELL